MTEIHKTDRAIWELIDAPDTHFWIAAAMRIALTKDPVDADMNFSLAAKLFAERLESLKA